MKKLRSYKKGEFIVMTEGSYSEYGLALFGRVLKDFDANELVGKWLRMYPSHRRSGRFICGKFIRWIVVDLKLVEELPMLEWYLGDYDRSINDMETIEYDK